MVAGDKNPLRELRWLFLDMDSYFASCEQQADPALRGRPVAVVPMLAENTCAIAASYEAKAFGVKTGMLVKEARQLCPAITFVPSRPKLYVEMHHHFMAAINQCIPIESVMSIDEVACCLDRREQDPAVAQTLAAAIKQSIQQEIGGHLTCSIGIASNKLLAKLASGMNKPNGITVLEHSAMPHAILHLPPKAFSGIGPRMKDRLALAGIYTMKDLWDADASYLRRVWGGVMGARFHALLHGADLLAPQTQRVSMGHQHVLAPDERTAARAFPVLRQLLARAALRLRHEDFFCCRLGLNIKWQGQLGHYVEETRFIETQDTKILLEKLIVMWRKAPNLKPLRVGIILAELVPAEKHQYSLFDEPQNHALTDAVDLINNKFGRGTINYGDITGPITSKIAFQRVPEREEV